MTLTVVASLVALALVDSTSIGTLVIPLWLVLAPGRPPMRRIVTYLVTLATFYGAVGVVLYGIARVGLPVIDGLRENSMVAAVGLGVGIALFWSSFRLDSARNRKRGKADRVQVVRARVLGHDGSSRTAVALAVMAGLSEVATMLPYLAAVGLLVSSGVSTVAAVGLLAAYCLVMIVPALILIVARTVAGARLDGPLHRLDGVFSKYADTALGWVVGIAGFLLASSSVRVLAGA